MKNGSEASTSGILKKIIGGLKSLAKSKIMSLKAKTNAIKARLIIFSLLRSNNHNFLIRSNNMSKKLQSLIRKRPKPNSTNIEPCEHDLCTTDKNYDKTAMAHAHFSPSLPETAYIISTVDSTTTQNGYVSEQVPDQEEEEEAYNHSEDDDSNDDKYTLLKSELGEGEGGGGCSVIDMVKHSKEEKGETFSLENEIDQVADLFIRRFHSLMRLQKQDSFNVPSPTTPGRDV